MVWAGCRRSVFGSDTSNKRQNRKQEKHEAASPEVRSSH